MLREDPAVSMTEAAVVMEGLVRCPVQTYLALRSCLGLGSYPDPGPSPSTVQSCSAHNNLPGRPKWDLIQTLHSDPMLHIVVTGLSWDMLGPHPTGNVALSLCGSSET